MSIIDLHTSQMLILIVVNCQLGKVYDQLSILCFLVQFGINSTHDWHNCTQLHLVQFIAIHQLVLLIPNCTQNHVINYTLYHTNSVSYLVNILATTRTKQIEKCNTQCIVVWDLWFTITLDSALGVEWLGIDHKSQSTLHFPHYTALQFLLYYEMYYYVPLQCE